MEPDLIGQEKPDGLPVWRTQMVPQWSLTSSVRKSQYSAAAIRAGIDPAMEPDLIGQEKHACRRRPSAST